MSVSVWLPDDARVSALEIDNRDASNTSEAQNNTREGSSVTLTVGGDALDKTVETGINEVAYRKHTVDVSVTDMMDYYLVLAGDPNL